MCAKWSDRNILYLHRSYSDLGRLFRRLLESFPRTAGSWRSARCWKILEPRFTSDTLAMLLNIPPQKTLLRRHLATNFSLLIGPEAQLEKREIMDSSAYTPLSTAAKVRPKKLGLSHFSNLRKKKFDDSTDYVCPVDLSPQKSDFKTPNNSSIKDIDKMEQMVHSEGMVKQIGAFSEGINNLTNMLSQDELLNNYRFLSNYDAWR